MKRYIIQTNNLALAAALGAMGIPLDNPPFVKTTGYRGGDQYSFYFTEKSLCGKYHTRELMKAWKDDNWDNENPDHPFAYIKAAFGNREKLLDKLNQSVPLVAIEKNGKLSFISANASDEYQTKIFSRL